jgi:predicted Zn finger-like uncharacterized protein
MDVRCEKCQTEYELDESRLKPGGVTVKCTNCGHMFKIRKRTPTNVGLPAVQAEAPTNRVRQDSANQRALGLAADTSRDETRREPMPQRTPPAGASPRADSVLGAITDTGSGPTTVERQWLVRLENGEQKTCRELATLQQWIVAGVATRESLISRSGKTWKRLGDIAELSQYFTIADEARTQRAAKPTPKPQAATMLGIGGRPGHTTGATAAGGTILPDDDDERKTTGNFRSRPSTPPPPPPSRTPSMGQPIGSGTLPKSPDASPVALQQTELSQPKIAPALPALRPTGAWASSEVKSSASMAEMPQGPRGGKLSMQDNEPAFAGRVRLSPGDESSFQTGRVSRLGLAVGGDDDDEDMIQPQRGSRAGTWIALLALVVIAAGAGAVYLFVFNKNESPAGKQDAGAPIATITADAQVAIISPIIDAAPADPLDGARSELLAGIEPRIKGVYDALAPKDDAASLAMRARLACGLAQSMNERAGLATDKGESDKLRKEAKQLVIDAAPLAQRAVKAAADDPSANLAMADVLRLQAKPIKDVRRYLEAAKAKGAADKELARSIALADALTLVRDTKLDDAQKALVALDGNGDARVQQELALVAYAQGKPTDAKPFVDQILAASPDHDVARALQKRLETAVSKTDPMPNEGSASVKHETPTPNTNNGGGDYDALVAKADKLASTSCANAMTLYGKALEQKPTGVEALTGMGYCYLDGKQFASAFSKFRSALAVSARFEPALAGVAETYQQQGNKDQAIESWQRYLDANPGSAKALKQLQILGAGATPTPPTPGTGSGSDTTPAPPPTPAPAPATTTGSAS